MTQMTHSGRLDATFFALADPTRRAILARLASGGEASVTELSKPFDMSQPAISKHLKVLERAGLISRGRDAQRRPGRIEGKPLGEVTGWLEQYRRFWEASFPKALNSSTSSPCQCQQVRCHLGTVDVHVNICPQLCMVRFLCCLQQGCLATRPADTARIVRVPCGPLPPRSRTACGPPQQSPPPRSWP